MGMKKVMAQALAIMIMLTIFLPGKAFSDTQVLSSNYQAVTSSEDRQAQISVEEAREVLINMFPQIFLDKDLQNEYSESGFNNNPCWSFRSKMLKNQSGMYRPEIEASVDAITGEVFNMNYYPEPALYKGKSVSLTRDQALQIAKEYLKKTNPDKVDALTLSDTDNMYKYYGLGYELCYTFSWNRTFEGIPVNTDQISIGVDAITGMVRKYTCLWHSVNFPQLTPTISKEELTRKLVDESGLYPSYVTVTDSKNSSASKNIPAYVINSSAVYYDCQTGQGLKPDGSQIDAQDIRTYKQTFTPTQNSKSITGYTSNGKQLSPEVLKKAAEEFYKMMGIEGEVEQSGGGRTIGEAGYNREFTDYSIVTENNNRRDIQVGIDLYTGEIVQFNQYSNDGDDGKSISREEALNKANEVIQKINPDKKGMIADPKENWNWYDTENYNFSFARLINGIPSEQQGIEVAINKNSGQLESYWSNWCGLKTDPLPKLITLEKAKEIYKSQEPFELTYILPIQIFAPIQKSSMDRSIESDPKLVYCNIEKSRVNAVTGEMFGGTILNENTVPFSEQGASPALSLLNANNLIPAEGINATPNRRQVLSVITNVINNQYYNENQDVNLAFTDINENDSIVQILKQAVQDGIISNQGAFNPDNTLSREELAVWLVNALGYQELATMKNSIDTPFKDADQISSDKANSVGIVTGLDIMNTDGDQCFNPKDPITWAEMANVAAQLATRYCRER